VWDSNEAIHNFAYKQKAHADIVRKTKKRKWYKEDMFNRFEILSTTHTS
jgi:hypothetical protein